MKSLVTAALLAVFGISLTGCVVSPQMDVAPAPIGIAVGWHGDRYYDGHRYWARDEWMRGHPNDRGWHGEREDRGGNDHRHDNKRHDDDHQYN
ncbi:hypothetical protein DIE23_31930 [Burkholderia sp. Bp9143]|uniref:hypothetical protein n=1 Tax=Burkholderia sp. Bp9143 TaxID=2184574 RepID=UPI000F5931D8|nr:hypothetical protein [Burkholderia sp. Bp9143]RQR25729.1 hypothetical protein DIE23_31930 [Burkholderia sp. Bp9143]